ncbi:Zinc/iron permease [Vararia minispora EC-137]|uniref:Zinc/iron permease n=1 Tax=Vararia minispora EC-137 TaxID=1314806 RepID=A0ACB8QQW0_9AGAM|nr:Zinc/iron permease [Vararia minispora EC-137]
MSGQTTNCGPGGGAGDLTALRIASIFIIGVGSIGGALFPVLAKRSSWLRVPPAVFDFAKYFGSGVIIATAFIHLLSPALDALSSPCLSEGWSQYPYALAIAMSSIFGIFIVELIAFRIGTARLKKLGVGHDAHGHGLGAHSAHGPEAASRTSATASITSQAEQSADEKDTEPHEQKLGHDHEIGPVEHTHTQETIAQIVGIAILEFGVMLHSVLIGLTLAVSPNFRVLFPVLVFHQTFEGLGIGSRLAFLKLQAKQEAIPIIAAVLYGLTTPIGIAAGLGVRTTYNPGTAHASIVSGVLDATSAGILIYTGLVELLAHEFIFSREMQEASNAKVLYAVGCMMLGCGVMALLGRWA